MRRAGIADLPLHYGRVPSWLASRLSDPFWFQTFGSVLGMDWHSSGITTSVMGAPKTGLNGKSDELGIFICGGRGRHSRNLVAFTRMVEQRFDPHADVDAVITNERVNSRTCSDRTVFDDKARHT